MPLNQQTLYALLDVIMRLEHGAPKGVVWADDYEAITRLAQALEAPQYITEEFARKAVEATPTNYLD